MHATESYAVIPNFTKRVILGCQAYYTCLRCCSLVHWSCRRDHNDWHEELESK